MFENDSPPFNVFPTDDTKAAAFAETKQTETMWQKFYENYKLNSYEPKSKEFGAHGDHAVLPCWMFLSLRSKFRGFQCKCNDTPLNLSGKFKLVFSSFFCSDKNAVKMLEMVSIYQGEGGRGPLLFKNLYFLFLNCPDLPLFATGPFRYCSHSEMRIFYQFDFFLMVELAIPSPCVPNLVFPVSNRWSIIRIREN